MPTANKSVTLGSGVGKISPLDIPAVAWPVVAANASKVPPDESGVVMKSILAVDPQLFRNAASPDLDVMVTVPKNFGWGVLS